MPRLTFLPLLCLLWLGGCSTIAVMGGKEIGPTRGVLLRGWTRSTHDFFGALKFGPEFAGVQQVDETLLYGSTAKGLIAFYPKLFLPKWNQPISGGIVSEFAVAFGKVYALGGDGNLVAVDFGSGKIDWTLALRTPFSSQPTVMEDSLYLTTSDDRVIKVDRQTGLMTWIYHQRSSPNVVLRGGSKPLVISGEVFAGMSDGTLVRLDEQTGTLKQSIRLHQGVKFTDIRSEVLELYGNLYISAYDGHFYCLHKGNLSTIWKYDVGSSRRVLPHRTELLVPGTDGSIVSLDPRSGRLNWRFELPGGGVPTELVPISNEHLVVGSSHNFLLLLKMEPGMARQLDQLDVGGGSGFYAPPFYDKQEDKIYALSAGGHLYQLRVDWKKLLVTDQGEPDTGTSAGEDVTPISTEG
jgi:outer membrane protein assembly factor BamB